MKRHNVIPQTHIATAITKRESSGRWRIRSVVGLAAAVIASGIGIVTDQTDAKSAAHVAALMSLEAGLPSQVYSEIASVHIITRPVDTPPVKIEQLQSDSFAALSRY